MMMMHSIVLIFLGFCSSSVLAKESSKQAPQQIHLSLGSNETEMIVTWITLKSIDETPLVYYGLMNGGNLNLKSKAEITKFKEGDTKFYTYRASMTQLKPNTQYHYQVGCKGFLSSVFKFKTLPSGNEWLPRFAIYGDLGYKNEQSLPYLSKDVDKDLFDVIWHIGDFAYDLHNDDGDRGHKFMQSIQPLASKVPYMACPGNHEHHKNFSHYDARFSMIGDHNPHRSLNERINNHFFSLDIGPAHIVLFSTEYYYYTSFGWDQIKHQYQWLERDLTLANQNRHQRPWLIVMGHRPLYCLKTGDDSCNEKTWERADIRQGIHMNGDKNSPRKYGLEDLFYKHNVDIQFYGHEHFYGRLLPIHNYTKKSGKNSNNPYENAKGPIIIITGSAGNQELHPKFNKLEDWVGAHFLDYGYTRLMFKSLNHIVLEQVSDDKQGKVLDKIDIIKDTNHKYSINNQIDL